VKVARRWLVAGVGVLLFAAACSGDTSGAPPSPPSRSTTTQPPPTPVRFHATLLQYRPDEGTNRVEVELTNRGKGPVTVRAVRISWAGVRHAPRTPKDTTYAAGQTIDLTTTYGIAVCGQTLPTDGPRAVVTLDDGRTVEMALDRHGSDMLKRFRGHDCALQRLHATASVSLGTTFHSVRVGGTEYLRGSLVLRRPADGDDSTAVTVSTLTGSVLLTFTAPPTSPLPATLQPGEDEIDVPVLIGSTFRCDDHGRSQSTQTFLLSAYVRLGTDRGLDRVIVVPDAHLRAQAQALMERACS
jgi:hypothetical protein